MKYLIIVTIVLLNSCATVVVAPVGEIKQFNDRGVLIYKDTKKAEYFYNSYGKLILKHNKNGKRYIYKNGKLVKTI